MRQKFITPCFSVDWPLTQKSGCSKSEVLRKMKKKGLASDPLKPGVSPRGDGTELGLD